MNALTTRTSTIALCAVLQFAGCSPREPAARGDLVAAVPTPQVAAADRPPRAPNDDCWYFAINEHELVAVWVSPRLPGQVPGGFRFVNLIYHDPSAKRPLLLHSKPAHSERSEPIAMRTGGLSFVVSPGAGKTWAEVVTRDDLNVDLDRP